MDKVCLVEKWEEGWRLTFIGDAEVQVDQSVEILRELQVHFTAILATLFLFEHKVNIRKRNTPSHKIHAVELLDQR